MVVKDGIHKSNFISTYSQSTNEKFLVKEKLQKTVVWAKNILSSGWKLIVEINPQAVQEWDATLYESLTRFRKLLETGPKYKDKDDLPHCCCVLMRSGYIWGISSDLRVLTVGRYKCSKLINRSRRPRNTQNAWEHTDNKVSHPSFGPFSSNLRNRVNSHTKSHKSHLTLGAPCDYPDNSKQLTTGDNCFVGVSCSKTDCVIILEGG